MFKRTQVVNWDGSGSSVLVAQDETDTEGVSESHPATESENELIESQTENAENDMEERKEPPRDNYSSSTYAATSQARKVPIKRGKRVFAP